MGQQLNYGSIEKITATGDPGFGTIPTASTAVGTIAASSTLVIGTLTKFRGDRTNRPLIANDHLYSPTLNELRRIRDVYDDTTLNLESAFSSAIANEPVRYCRIKYTSVSISNTGSTDAGFDGGTVPPGETETYSSELGIDPVTYAASGNTLKINLIR